MPGGSNLLTCTENVFRSVHQHDFRMVYAISNECFSILLHRTDVDYWVVLLTLEVAAQPDRRGP